MQSYLLSLQLLLYHSVLDFLILKHENKNKQASKRRESNRNFAQIPQQYSLAKFNSFLLHEKVMATLCTVRCAHVSSFHTKPIPLRPSFHALAHQACCLSCKNNIV
jgi:hypothetical protein